MADNAFVPLLRPGAAAPSQNGFTPLAIKTLHQANGHTAPHAEGATPCQEPSITLQRDGDKITAIHIECACGQVIDLACDY